MTEAARPILRGEARITLRADTVEAARSGPVASALVAEEDAALLSALKARRRALAEVAAVPAYIIFPDRTLIEMAQRQPQSLDALMGITGVGAKKLATYGTAFLEVLTGASATPLHPARQKLAGSTDAEVFDRLAEAQLALARGPDGTGKVLSCSRATLGHIARQAPRTLPDLARLPGMDAQKLERFGAAFLDIVSGGA